MAEVFISPLLPQGIERCPYRFPVCGSYMIFCHADKDAVMVDRVLYGRRDYPALLFGDLTGYGDE